MKAAVLLVLVALVLVPHDAEAGFFRRIWQGIKNGARAVGDAVGKAARTVRDYIREKGISVSISRSIRDVSHLDHGQNYTQDIGNETLSMVYDIIRKSGVTLKSELDLTTVRELFFGADENKDGVLKGDDIVVFIALLEGVVHGENEVDPKGPK